MEPSVRCYARGDNRILAFRRNNLRWGVAKAWSRRPRASLVHFIHAAAVSSAAGFYAAPNEAVGESGDSEGDDSEGKVTL